MLALLGVLFNCIANADLPARDNPCSKAALSNEELQDLAVRPPGEQAARFTKFQTFKSCATDFKALATESV